MERNDRKMNENLDLEYFNGSYDDIKDCHRNLWLGASISLRPYDEELARRYVGFVAEHSKDRAVIMIGDDLAWINYKVLEKYKSDVAALKKARRIGDVTFGFYEGIVNGLDSSLRDKVEIVRWKDVLTEDLESKICDARALYEREEEFRDEVHIPIADFLKNKGRTVTLDRLEALSGYILSELPLLCNGLECNGIRYSAMFYPTYDGSSLDRISLAIQRGERFSELREKWNLKGDHILIDAYIERRN